MFRQRVLNGDLVCNLWVDNSANWVAERPGVEVKDWRKLVLYSEVVDHYVGMAIRRECLHELADCREMAKPEAEGWLWLGFVSGVLKASLWLTYQTIESASMLV